MYQLDNILVCLDLSDMDDSLIRYSNYLVEKFKPTTVTFLHVMKSYDIPEEIISAFPHLNEPISEVVKEELTEKINELFKHDKTTKTIISVKEGTTTDTIVRYAREQNITLTLMGKKIGYEGQGGIVRKVLNIVPSSVLLISETSQPKMDHLMVRMDFSKMSAMALRMAIRMKESTGAKISCHHVYKLPLKYFPQSSPKNDKKLMEHVERHSKKEYAKFIKKNKLEREEIPCTNSLDPENEEANILYRQALTIGADLILIGSKIKSEMAEILIDSTSEKLAAADKNIPAFIVKDRKQTMGFLKALFK
ncbi:Nucleotide-binding universal stress protein, UspA family [Tangfeifania diversioriginum]|uniref:Nucleotide-binding universal stress protein, UspA family n=1 Tax=Tangfeifania diversioriginum TaxID=1168035 RepID=A0A1M6G641_9BACT|nr:universal stress protein [Tangfeifania diversioriginum]SHJ05415.1 Nucleotide-binding universal stress protein, UspA family [Tangfeifania diversioriginum]